MPFGLDVNILYYDTCTNITSSITYYIEAPDTDGWFCMSYYPAQAVKKFREFYSEERYHIRDIQYDALPKQIEIEGY